MTINASSFLLKFTLTVIFLTQINMEMVCSICFERIGLNETGSVHPCLHSSFHSRCILNWARISSSCPLCKSSIQHVNDTAILPINVLRESFRPSELMYDSDSSDGSVYEDTLEIARPKKYCLRQISRRL